MRKHIRQVIVPAVLMLLGGCQTGPVYHPSELAGAPGYSDEQLVSRFRNSLHLISA